jgi:hypothetical protein
MQLGLIFRCRGSSVVRPKLAQGLVPMDNVGQALWMLELSQSQSMYCCRQGDARSLATEVRNRIERSAWPSLLETNIFCLSHKDE